METSVNGWNTSANVALRFVCYFCIVGKGTEACFLTDYETLFTDVP